MGASLPSRSSSSEGGVDMYVGGTEHATRHLIYARFWHKFLFDIGMVSGKEPFIGLKNQGLIMGNDGRKMSKRWGISWQSGRYSKRIRGGFFAPV